MAGSSKKTRVIEILFFERWDAATKTLKKSVVTFDELKAAVQKANAEPKAKAEAPLSDANLANFFKDLVRKHASFERNWPATVKAAGYWGEQRTGQGREVFEFIPIAAARGLSAPGYPKDPTRCTELGVPTISLPPWVRKLGRWDETSLVQLMLRLNVIETHLGVVSRKGLQHVEHLQVGVKQRGSEIDALFFGELRASKGRTPKALGKRHVLITLEMKGLNEDIIESQIKSQVQAVLNISDFKDWADLVIPMAAKAIGSSRIYLAEYGFVVRDRAFDALQLTTEAVYQLKPPIRGL